MEMTGKHQNNYLKSLASRVRCELNDLKRTKETAAVELGLSDEYITKVLEGSVSEEEYYNFIMKMSKVYPIDCSHLQLIKKDTLHGVKFISSSESQQSKRIYQRLDGHSNNSDYYEYRDTAMSNLSLFKPEWIEVLKEVSNNDPYNLKVVMNNGHFMHQTTLFIGPVNFYYEDESGIRHCCEMNTGDSNYISPFLKHSFTSRDKNAFTCILAVTYGGDVSRSQRELYALGANKLNCFLLNKTYTSLIKQHMKNNLFSIDVLDSLIKEKNKNINIKEIINMKKMPNVKELETISSCLNVSIDKIMPRNKSFPKCIIKKNKNNKYFFYPNNEAPIYKIKSLANDNQTDLMKNSIVCVLAKKHNFDFCFEKSMHTYLINYSDTVVEIRWEHEGKLYDKEVKKFDSMYLEPFTKFSFIKKTENEAHILVVGIKSSISLEAQKELTNFVNPERTINQLELWYEKK